MTIAPEFLRALGLEQDGGVSDANELAVEADDATGPMSEPGQNPHDALAALRALNGRAHTDDDTPRNAPHGRSFK